MARIFGTENKKIGAMRAIEFDKIKRIHDQIKADIQQGLDTEREHQVFGLLDTSSTLDNLITYLHNHMSDNVEDEATINLLCGDDIDYALAGHLNHPELTEALTKLQLTFTVVPVNLTNTSDRLITTVTINESASSHTASRVKPRATAPNDVNKSHPSIQRDKDDDEGNIHIDDMRL